MDIDATESGHIEESAWEDLAEGHHDGKVEFQAHETLYELLFPNPGGLNDF
jgi:hypothetical protein